MATIEPNFESICIDPNDDLVLYKKEIVRSRIEKFLYAICSLDNDDLPTPLSRIEEMYKCLVTGVDFITFTPLSRAEKFVMAMLGAYDVELLPTPNSRSEILMKKIATGDNNLDDIDNLQSRYEFLLAYIIKAGGFNGGSEDFYYNLTSLTSGFTTIYDTLDKPVKNAVLRGQTLVNLVKKLTPENLGGNKEWGVQGSSNPTHTCNSNGSITMTSTIKGSMVLNYYNLTLFKPNTEYTLFISVGWNGVGVTPHFSKISTNDIPLNNGLNIVKFMTASDLTVQNMSLRLGYIGTVAVGCEYTFNNIMVLEGDWTNVDIPYFEGMQSVKMPVLTTVGKNLFDGEFKLSTYSSGKIIIPNGNISSVSFPYTTTANSRGICCITQVKPNTNYTISIVDKQENTVLLGDGYNNLNDISSQTKSVLHVGSVDNANHTTLSFTTPSNCNYMIIGCYIKYSYAQSGGTITFNEPPKIQLEEHSVATPYEPHKSNILTCNEEVELRGIGDIKDELNLVTGKYTTAIYEYTFTGDEIWTIGGKGYTYFECRMNQLPFNYKYKTDANIPISCNNLPTVTYNDFDNRIKSVGINLTYFFRLNFSDCDSNNGATVEDLKAYLKANPTTVQYPISKSVKTVDLSTLNQDGKETKLKTFDDITHVIVSSEGLIPTGEIDIARPIQFVDYSLDNGWTTLYNTIERPVKNAVLRGQTLVNVSSLTGVTTLKPGNAIFIENTGMKVNTTYTIMFNCSNIPSTNFVEIRTMMDNTQITQVQQNVSAGYNKFTIKTHTSKETNRFRFKNDTTSTTDFIFSELVILEGDYTNENIPYFEGMTSVKMPVLKTTGKNLFYSTLESGDFDTSTGIPNNNSKSIVRTKEYNEISPNKTYHITVFNPPSTLSTFTVYQYDNDFNFIKRTDSNVVTTNANTKYVKFRFRQSDNSEFTKEELAALSCMITEGDTIPNTYEPYKSTAVSCNEEVILRGIGDVKDELNLITGELTRRIGEIVLNGDENWGSYGSQSSQVNTVAFKLSHTNHISSWGTGLGYCDKLLFTNGSVMYDKDVECVTTDANNIIVRVNLSKASSVDEFKAWLSNNNIRVVCLPKEEVIKTVDLSIVDQDDDVLLILENGGYIITENDDYIKVGTKGGKTKLKTFDDITHVIVSSEGLIPTGEITVATKDATDVIEASVMSLRMDDILNSQRTLEESANTQSDDIDVTMLGSTDIYEQLL